MYTNCIGIAVLCDLLRIHEVDRPPLETGTWVVLTRLSRSHDAEETDFSIMWPGITTNPVGSA